MLALRLSFDTGACFDIIPKSALPPGCESGVAEKAKPPRLNDGNARPLSLGRSIRLTLGISNKLYRVKFISAEWLAVEVIIGTTF